MEIHGFGFSQDNGEVGDASGSELSVLMGMHGCGEPILMSVWWRGGVSLAVV